MRYKSPMRYLSCCVLVYFGCSTDNGPTTGSPGSTGTGGNQDMAVVDGDGSIATGTITVSPADDTLDLVQGQSPPSQSYTATMSGKDVTSHVTWSLADNTLGSMLGNTFTSGGSQGGSTTLLAEDNGQTGNANIHVRVHGVFSTSDCTSCNPLPSAAPACAGNPMPPSILYPLDGVLLPPNMGTISVQFTPGAGNTQFEVDFQNASTDVQLAAKCNMVNGGCRIDVPLVAWNFVAGSNRGGDPVQVTVRASPDGICATASSAVRINFAEKDVTGAIYYWKSTVSASGTGGQIWRKSFADTTPEEEITNTGGLGGTCFGCHQLSRDGQRMTVNADDDDSDDEYGDVQSALIDVGTKMFLGGTDPNAFNSMGQPAGFQTFSPDHTIYLGSSGDGTGTNAWGGGTGLSNGFFAWNGDSAANLTPISVGTMSQRPTMPDWSADGKNVVYVIPDHIGDTMYTDDDHVFGGSLWTMPYLGMGSFGMPKLLLQSAGENNYYPSYSPDGQFVVFDRVAPQTSTAVAASDSFANPNARVFVLPVGMGSTTPIDCALLNGTGALSNSWPRWSPFIQTYKGSSLLWITFSSTRDYGVQIPESGRRQDSMLSARRRREPPAQRQPRYAVSQQLHATTDLDGSDQSDDGGRVHQSERPVLSAILVAVPRSDDSQPHRPVDNYARQHASDRWRRLRCVRRRLYDESLLRRCRHLPR